MNERTIKKISHAEFPNIVQMFALVTRYECMSVTKKLKRLKYPLDLNEVI